MSASPTEGTDMNQIEKVARAMCRADPEVRMGDADGVVEQRVNTEWVHYVDQAKAAIAAMQPAPQEPVGSAAEITRLTEALRAAEEEKKALREALAFYARENSWKSCGMYMSGRPNPSSAELDAGNKARQALAGAKP